MIRITDMTLSCLSGIEASEEKLRMLIELLLQTGIDLVEMPAAVYRKLKLSPSGKYIVRITSPEESDLYPDISRFICRKSGAVANISVAQEIQINDIREINFLSRYTSLQRVRIVGLDDVLCHDYETVFRNIKKQFQGIIEFCPENSMFCATASAVEWVSNGGTDIVTSFGGIGGRAPLEEVLIALKIVKRYKPNASYELLHRIAKLMEEILSESYPPNKSVIGERIFDVESGIHIDGILKKPEMYEPFLPELVGGQRRFIIGKHSGRKALCIKLEEFGINPQNVDISALLSEVRDLSIIKMSGLTDEEFIELSEKYRR